MEVTIKQLRRCDVVVAKGRIDSETVKTLAETFDTLKKEGRFKVVLNLREVTFVSSAGLTQMIEMQNTCKQLLRGELVLVEVPERIIEVLDLAGLRPLFRVFETEVEAVDNF